ASPGAVSAAAQQLHQTLQDLIKEHANDPGVAEQAAQLLQAEIALLEVRGPEGANQVLAQARTLVRLLSKNAPPQVRATVAPLLDAVSTPRPSSKPPAKPKATTSPKPSPSPTPKVTTTSPTPKPSASATTDDDGPLHAP
ncbi:MAG TPA: hypothetical protein VFQ85_18775, partial [Mycobacteriales bacterium]|nr:hypothetical protein [Mycobacteriales bacterium]